MSKFVDLGLSEDILKAVEKLGFEEPTPIQAEVIPQLIKDPKDIIALAQTGTGKTAAFGLPLLELIDTSLNHTQALILAPTRELGQQIADQLFKFSAFMPRVNMLAVYGGVSIQNHLRALKKPVHIIIATPGRLIDLINRRAIKLQNIGFMILDEADEMLNMGFKEDIDEILKSTPAEKLTWLFSATMPREIRRIVDKYMNNPIEAAMDSKQVVNENIDHQFVITKASGKTEIIKRFLDVNENMRGIIFCRTKRETQEVAEQLSRAGYRADALNGDMSQSQRDRVMKMFKQKQLQILVATDVAARGIDVSDLTHVIHHKLPDDLPFYTHRSGRTARAGKKGISLVLVTSHERRRLSFFEKKLGISFSKADVPSKEAIKITRMIHWADSIVATVGFTNTDPKIIEQVTEKLAELSKEELVHKLVTIELKKIGFSDRIEKDDKLEDFGSDRGVGRGRRRDRDRDRGGRREKRRDDRRSSSRDRSDRKKDRRDSDRGERRGRRDSNRGERRERRPRGNKVRFFINIGKMDSVTKPELIDFISSQTNIQNGDISDVVLLQKHAYFDVPKDSSTSVSKSFEGLDFDGRDLRVNEDR